MPVSLFAVKYITENGRRRRVHQKDFYVSDEAQVRREVYQLGGHVLAIRSKKTSWARRIFNRSKIQQLQILRLLLNHVGDRLSPGMALTLLIQDEKDRRRRQLMNPAYETLSRGGSFSEALAATAIFDQSTLNIITAGDLSGSVQPALAHAVEQIEAKNKSMRHLTVALGWLSLDLFAALTSVAWTYLSFLPDMRTSGVDTTDPEAIAKFNSSLDFAIVASGFLYYLAIFVSVASVLIWMVYREDKGTLAALAKRVVARMPVISTYLNNIGLADAFGSLGRMLKSSVRLTDAISITARNTSVAAVHQMLEHAHYRLEAGDTPEQALQCPLLTSIESYDIGHQLNMQQLGETFSRLGVDRFAKADQARRNLIFIATVSSTLYTVLATLTALGAIMIQSQGLMEGFKSIGHS